MTEQSPVGESELHAHADGRLQIERIPAVEAFLAADPLARARVAPWRTQNELISRLYEPAASHPWPERLAVWRLRARSRRRLVGTAAAAVVALSLGLAGGWWAHGLQPVQPTALTTFARVGVELHRMATQGTVDSPLE